VGISIQIPQKIFNELRPFWFRRWTIIVCAWIISVFGWLVVAVLPDQYEAMTRIYVQTETLLTPLLRNIAVQTDIQKQLEVLQRTLLNRNNLAQVAHSTDLDLDAQTEADKDALYASLAKRVTIKAEGQNLFLVSFRDANPKLAKKAVETLLSLFVETNLGQNRTSMESARNFLENQIQEYEQKLKNADQRLAEYKAQNVDLLSSTGSNFSSRVESMRHEVFSAQSHYDNAVVVRDQLRTTLAGTPQYLDINSTPQVVINNDGNFSSSSPRLRVQHLRTQLSQLQARFTDTYPDVVSTKQELEHAQAELEREEAEKKNNPRGEAAAGVKSASNPVYEQIKLRLVQAESDVLQAQSQLNRLNVELTRLQGMAEVAPRVEAELADLSREYGVIKAKFEELLGRRESARISEAVESSGDKVQFRIIEAPQVPSRPGFPNRPLLVTLVMLASIAVGIGLVFLMHQLDDTVSSTAVLSEEFNIRVLGSVSKVESALRRTERQRNGRNFLLACSSLFAAYVAVLIATQLWQLPVLLAKLPLPASLLQRISDYAG